MSDRETLEHRELWPAGGEANPRPSERLRQRVMAATRQTSRFEGFTKRFAACIGSSEDVARQMLVRIDDEAAWHATQNPGHRTMKICGYGEASADKLMLVAIEPGCLVPLHRHRNDELAFCMQGGAELRPGLVIEPGDFVITPAGELHRCLSVRRQACIMLLRRRRA